MVKNSLVVSLFLLAAVCVVAGDKQPAQKDVVSFETETDTLVVEARITDIPGKFPPNDLYNYVYIMKYRVIAVKKGSYGGKEILVGVYNPLIPRSSIRDKMARHATGNAPSFSVGDRHRLVLITPVDRIWSEAVEDEFFDSELTKYYALRADKIQ